MLRVATIVLLILAASLALIAWAAFAKGHPVTRAAGSLLAIALLLLGLNNLRDIPWFDDGLDAAFPPHAIRSSASPACADMRTRALRIVGDDGEESMRDMGPYQACPVQTVVNEPARLYSGPLTEQECWSVSRNSTAPPPLCFRMAFLEFGRKGALLDRSQLGSLLSTIAYWRHTDPRREIYLITFVHGWRHGAGIGDSEVRRLRVIASYAASHLQERCRVAGQHCGAMVLAVYAAWPAATSIDGKAPFFRLMAAPSFPRRKKVSDDVGFGILNTLDTVYAALHQTSDAAGEMLLMGHSLGGNALLTGAAPRLHRGFSDAAQAIDHADEPRVLREHLGLPADLTVILNPASEAEKLDKIRQDAAGLFKVNPLRGSLRSRAHASGRTRCRPG